jgi:hypothetical protein
VSVSALSENNGRINNGPEYLMANNGPEYLIEKEKFINTTFFSLQTFLCCYTLTEL